MEITDLIKRINDEHRHIIPRGPEQLDHAIKCGELLLEAKKFVPKGQWVAWLDKNVEVYRTTAFKYIRLAQNKDKVKGKFTGIDPAIDFIAGKRELSEHEKHEILVLKNDVGKTVNEIAKMLDISKSTVSYYINAKDRNRTKRLQRGQRAQAQRALQREQDIKFVKSVAGKEVADAYALLRRVEQRLQQAIESKVDWHLRRYLSEALDKCYGAEDDIVKALRTA